MSIGKRIKQLRGNESRRTFSEKLGVAQNTIVHYEMGRRLPNSDFIESLCQLYNISSDWLIYGKEPSAFGPATVTDGEFFQVPIMGGELSAGSGRATEEPEEQRYFKVDMEDARALGTPQNLRAMEVRGDSMEPIIYDKDMILFDISRTDVRDGKTYAVAWDGHLYIKKLLREPNKLILRSVNPQYHDITINLQDEHEANSVKILGQAVWWCHAEQV